LQGLATFQIALTMSVGAWQIARGNIGAGDLITFALWLNLLQMPIRSIGFSLNNVMRAVSSSERIFELLDAQSVVKESPSAVPLENPVGDVKFEAVAFGYDNLSAVPNGIDPEANPVQVSALRR